MPFLDVENITLVRDMYRKAILTLVINVVDTVNYKFRIINDPEFFKYQNKILTISW